MRWTACCWSAGPSAVAAPTAPSTCSSSWGPDGLRARRGVGRGVRRQRIVRPGRPVHITGRIGGSPRQLVVQALRAPAPGTWRDEDLHDGPPRSAAHMEEDLRKLVATVRNPHLGALLDRFFGEGSETWARYRQAPAAKFFHQAYRHGLLEHSLTVAQAVERGQRDRSRASTATSPSPARCCTTSASSRPTRPTRRASTSPTPAGSRARSRSATTACGARSRRLDGFPPRARRGAAAHHPRPPRLARARQPGRALHARGDARARDRQPRRPARLLRPAREGASRPASAGRASTARSAGPRTSRGS